MMRLRIALWGAVALTVVIGGAVMAQPPPMMPMRPMMPMGAPPPPQQQKPGAAYGQMGGGPSMHGDADKSQLSLGGGYVSAHAHILSCVNS